MRRDPSIPALGSLEAKIMQVLWERPGEYLSVRDPAAARRRPRLHDRHDGDGPASTGKGCCAAVTTGLGCAGLPMTREAAAGDDDV